ncbi:c-type cytochrome [Nocardioides pocheonensis]|uniref:cytochrome bc1 complex diheme cytochrome c subunit n=1 Tax=Nocardioides pocheonensis TaxID=661485 RepID=UPI001619B14B|nr:c-type cytochrome [Nocardioides pocheonensis]
MRLITRKISARLSTRRRSRYAAPAVLVAALLAAGGLYVALSPADATNKADDASMIAKGRSLFQVGCSSCHGQNAEGIVTKRGKQYGPSLVGVGAAAVDFQVGTGRMPMAQPGVQAARKKPVYNQDEIDALGAYVQSLGPGPAVPDITQSDIDNADVVKGGQFFRTNCTACHNFAGSGGALPGGKHAPSLRGVSAKHLYEAMLTGPQQMPVFSDGVLSPQDKKDIIAYLKKNEATPSYGGFTLGSIGPVSEGLFAWIVGIGSLVGIGIWLTSSSTRSTKKKGDAA